MITLVLFDLDDTLFAHRGAVEAGILAHRVAHGLLGDDLAELARWNELEEVHYHRYLTGELDFLEQRRERVRGFVGPHGLTIADADADAWFERYLAEYRVAWKLHDDALPVLDELEARGIRTGIITNGDIVFQSSKIDGLGIADRFEHVVASGSVGVAKPDARIFQMACALFDVPPEAAAYVGDRLETDAVGAASAGLTGVWLARGEPTEEQLARAAEAGARVIRSLHEIRDLL